MTRVSFLPEINNRFLMQINTFSVISYYHVYDKKTLQ